MHLIAVSVVRVTVAMFGLAGLASCRATARSTSAPRAASPVGAAVAGIVSPAPLSAPMATSPDPTAPSLPQAPREGASGQSAMDRSVEVPAALAAAPKWIGRTYQTSISIAPDPDRHVTYELQRSGRDALVTVVTREETVIDHRRQLDLPRVSRVMYVGTVTEKAGVSSITVENGVNKLLLRCTRTRISAARADAVRAYQVREQGYDCGDPGRWIPATTRSLVALRCKPDPGKASGSRSRRRPGSSGST